MRSRWILSALLGSVALGACTSHDAAGNAPRGDCPTAPVSIVVSVGQWGDIVRRLAGDCGVVTTVFTSAAADPHDYEPAPADIAEFTDAGLVVSNGLGYDTWADQAVATLDTAPAVVNAGKVAGLDDGDNPHIWYAPEYVHALADAVTDDLIRLAPEATKYFEQRQTSWRRSMRRYDDAVTRATAAAKGRTYGATEGVFDHMAGAIGLTDETPPGFRRAAANETDPGPGDVNAFLEALGDGAMTALIFNRQTEGAIPQQIHDEAAANDVPVVTVTESMPERFQSFVDWQVTQLDQLTNALEA